MSVFGSPLPSPREISTRIHNDKNNEMPSVTMMFMQWGQFLDHDITSTAQARSFNNSVPRCCQPNGQNFLPPELTVSTQSLLLISPQYVSFILIMSFIHLNK